MVSDIIKAFEKDFKKYADGTEALSYKMVKDEDCAIGMLVFSDFNVWFQYNLEYEMRPQKSCLGISLEFSKKTGRVLCCNMYDIMPLIDEKNMSCWLYSYIENPQRMSRCFEAISRDFGEVLPKLVEFAADRKNIDALEAEVEKNFEPVMGIREIKSLKRDFSYDENMTAEEVEYYMFNLYSASQYERFSSCEYSDFLSGDRRRALKKYKKRKNRIRYEDNIIRCLEENGDSLKNIIDEDCDSLRDGLKESSATAGAVPFLLSFAILFPLFSALCVGLYYAAGSLLYREMLYSTSLVWYNSLYCLIPSCLCSIAAALIASEKVFRKFFYRRADKKQDYDSIFLTERKAKRHRVFFYLVYILTIVFVFLNVNNAVSFGEYSVTDSRGYFNITGKSYGYEDIDCLCLSKGEYINGVWTQAPKYYLITDSGTKINLTAYVGNGDIEENILPIIESKGVAYNVVDSLE